MYSLGIIFFMERLSKERLEELLREAKEAHSEFEQELGHEDEDWATWYAEYMIDRLEE